MKSKNQFSKDDHVNIYYSLHMVKLHPENSDPKVHFLKSRKVQNDVT